MIEDVGEQWPEELLQHVLFSMRERLDMGGVNQLGWEFLKW